MIELISSVLVDFEFEDNSYLAETMAYEINRNNSDFLKILHASCKRMRNNEKYDLLAVVATKFEKPLAKLMTKERNDSDATMMIVKVAYEINYHFLTDQFRANLDFWMASFMRILNVSQNFEILIRIYI